MRLPNIPRKRSLITVIILALVMAIVISCGADDAVASPTSNLPSSSLSTVVAQSSTTVILKGSAVNGYGERFTFTSVKFTGVNSDKTTGTCAGATVKSKTKTRTALGEFWNYALGSWSDAVTLEFTQKHSKKTGFYTVKLKYSVSTGGCTAVFLELAAKHKEDSGDDWARRVFNIRA